MAYNIIDRYLFWSPKPFYREMGPFDTPINLDGDRHNNRVENLTWRPRWFAIKYNQQFRHPYENPIPARIMDLKTGEVSENSFQCAQRIWSSRARSRSFYYESHLCMAHISRIWHFREIGE